MKLNLDSAKDDIVSSALALGFFEVRVAKAESLDSELRRLKFWLESGNHADMMWMERDVEKRCDPRLMQENCKSVIILATSYNPDGEYKNNVGMGKVARYAWGRDYHKVLSKKMKKLLGNLKEEYPEHEFRAFTDTAPILERAWAEKSGIGWQGKHSLIINRKRGSYFFLSVILSTMDLETDPPDRDRCGKCTKCIDACPTGAIVSDKIIDARKCISYWTIESRAEAFPENIEKNLSGRIFGCDICQEVCPWNNHRVPKTEISEFLGNNKELNINELSEMDEKYYRNLTDGTALKRAKQDGLRRNAKALEKYWAGK
jgi:epoxyqueuosine reductase